MNPRTLQQRANNALVDADPSLLNLLVKVRVQWHASLSHVAREQILESKVVHPSGRCSERHRRLVIEVQ